MLGRTKQQLNNWKRLFAVLLCFTLLFNIAFAASVYAEPQVSKKQYGKTLSLDQAKSLGVSNSAKYASLSSKLALAQAKYTQSVKKIQLKRKNQASFRWSPLLSFKLPEKPDLADEFQYAYEPIALQSNIETIRHQMTNDKYTVYEKVSTLFVKCYTLQESIAFTNDRVETLHQSLEKNKALVLAGQANQSDVDKIESTIRNLETKLNNDMRSYESEKEKLTNTIGLDVRSGYTFLNPYVTAQIDRSKYDDIVAYAEERDEGLYEAKVTTANALIALDTNEQLMRNQYGSKMSIISSFIQQAKGGQKIDTAAFKLKYDEFLKKIDEPWNGHFRILFIKIPKEWIKGEIDGVRYVEDEPYALYEAAIDYQDAYLDQQQTQKDLEEQLKDAFDNYISVRQAYIDLAERVDKKAEEVKKATAQNLLGKLTYDELSDLQKEYEDMQMELLQALSDYTLILASLDKLSCGAITDMLKSASISTNTAGGGNSYIIPEDADYVVEKEEGVFYYIHTFASENMFEFGIFVPSDFKVSITGYELWVNDTKIGEKTDPKKPIKHLGLDFDSVDNAFVRLFNGNKVIDDCSFDPSVYSAKLAVTTGYEVEVTEDPVIATYAMDINQTTGLVTFTIKTDNKAIAFYDIKTPEGEYIANARKQTIDTKLKYLGLVSQDMSTLIFCFYDQDGNLLYECRANTTQKELTEIKGINE